MILDYAEKAYDRICLQTQVDLSRNCEDTVVLLGFCSGVFAPVLDSHVDCNVYGSCISQFLTS